MSARSGPFSTPRFAHSRSQHGKQGAHTYVAVTHVMAGCAYLWQGAHTSWQGARTYVAVAHVENGGLLQHLARAIEARQQELHSGAVFKAHTLECQELMGARVASYQVPALFFDLQVMQDAGGNEQDM